MNRKSISVKMNAIHKITLMRKKSSLKEQESERGMVEARPRNFGEWTCKMADECIIGSGSRRYGRSGMLKHPIKVAPRRDSSLNPIWV